jgi:hypothetical protein
LISPVHPSSGSAMRPATSGLLDSSVAAMTEKFMLVVGA